MAVCFAGNFVSHYLPHFAAKFQIVSGVQCTGSAPANDPFVAIACQCIVVIHRAEVNCTVSRCLQQSAIPGNVVIRFGEQAIRITPGLEALPATGASRLDPEKMSDYASLIP
jgi:hypothetical protein